MEPHLTTELADAACRYLAPSAAAALAQAYRDGDDTLSDLVAGLRWLIYAAHLPDSCHQLLAERPDLAEPLRLISIDHEDWPGIAWLAIYESIAGRGKGKGARNPKSKLADDPYCHVIAELQRAWREAQLDIGNRIDPHIRPPHSTNSKRKKKGKAPYSVRRRERTSTVDREINGHSVPWLAIEDHPDPETNGAGAPKVRSGLSYLDESQLNNGTFEVWDAQRLELVDDTEAEICRLLHSFYTLREIADELGITLHDVRKTITAIRERNT